MKKRTPYLSLIFFATGFHFFATANDFSEHNYYDFARVINVEPIYQTVRQTKSQGCISNAKPMQSQSRIADHAPQSIANEHGSATLIGGIVGGIIGNQFGSGGGRVATTAIGAILGGTIGHQASEEQAARELTNRQASTKKTILKNCDKKIRNVSSQLVGYNYSYRYRGTLYHGTSVRHPGDRIRLAITITPIIDE